MATAVTNTTHATPTVATEGTPAAKPAKASQKTSQAQAESKAPSDTVKISTAARSALQESQNTSVATAKGNTAKKA